MNIEGFATAETGVALSAGRYDYYLNNVIQDISETWAVFENSRGEILIDSCRRAGGLMLRSRAVCVGDEFEQVLVEWCADHKIQALYKPFEQCCIWQINDDVEREFPLPVAPIYPLMRVYTGAVIKRIADLGGSAQIIVPDIRLDTAPDKKLQPTVSERRSALLADDDIFLEGRRHKCQRWSFIGDQYDKSSEFWLDAEGNLLCYSWLQAAQQRWRVQRAAIASPE